MAMDNNSTYYDAGGIEVIAIQKAKLTSEQFIGAMLFNVIKYATRINFKHESKLRDAEKIKNYANALLEAVKENESK